MEQPLAPETLAYYARGREVTRLRERHGLLEFARTCDILQRWLPGPPADVLDVGGGPGAYAVWLAGRGHRVALVDPVALHVAQARAAATRAGQPLLARIGDGRRLERSDGAVDAVLLLGPLYHLTERSERLRALREAHRVLRPGGLLFAAGVSRFASLLLSGVFDGLLADPAFRAIVQQDLVDGQHRNPTSCHDYFTTTFFHPPMSCGRRWPRRGSAWKPSWGSRGPAGPCPTSRRAGPDSAWREQILAAARAIESEPSLLGFHPHILTVGRRARHPG